MPLTAFETFVFTFALAVTIERVARMRRPRWTYSPWLRLKAWWIQHCYECGFHSGVHTLKCSRRPD